MSEEKVINEETALETDQIREEIPEELKESEIEVLSEESESEVLSEESESEILSEENKSEPEINSSEAKEEVQEEVQEEEKEKEKEEEKEEEDLRTKYLRLAADFQNFRRRSEKEKATSMHMLTKKSWSNYLM
jgi:molecular chaperone GrpE